MSCIFLSHSSADELETVALKQWLRDNGWDDVFLDIDPDRGLAAGERWQEALRRAADRCEAVVFVVSPAWAKSKWCLTEFLLAKSLSKLIFGVVLKEIPIGELPTEMTAEWQLCHLVGQGSTETIRFTHKEKPVEVTFLAEGLRRLRSGLQSGGLSASFFPWPPKDDMSRAPYRGLEPLDARDAAIFFGRDAEILQGLDKLRGMRASGEEGLFVILGASGAGKSSFLRAGLLPRLARDDRHFFPLEIVRPERSPLFGERGLAHAICKANSHLQLEPVNPGDVKAGLKESAERFAALLRNIQNAARVRLLGLPDSAPPPTLVLSVDQAEELFNADAPEEARAFLTAIGAVLRGSPTGAAVDRGQRVPMIVAFTIRSDRYEPLQTASELAGLKTVVFDALRPMPLAQFKDVIIGPANRTAASGSRLELRPDLVAQLLADCAQGVDTLPLLSLALARLYREYGGDGDLQLDEYTRMGGMADVIKTEAESILATDTNTRNSQLELLHAAFIPWLATINADNDQPMRRLAHMDELPKDSRPLVQALIDRRLLVSDMRCGEQVVEVAHESLLRQWDVLADWLGKERDDLKEADRLEQFAAVWIKKDKKADWLIAGERLAVAEALAAKPTYRRRLEPVSEFLLASRQKETQRRAEEERQRQAELVAAREKQAAAEALAAEQLLATERAQADTARLKKLGLMIGLLFLVAVALAIYSVLARNKADLAHNKAVLAQKNAEHEREVAQKERAEAIWHRQTATSERMLDGRIPGGNLQAMLQSVAALRFKAVNDSQSAVLASLVFSTHTRKIIDLSSMRPTPALAFSPDGMRIAVGGEDGSVLLLDAMTGKVVGPRLTGLPAAVWSLSFSGDSARLIIGVADSENTESNEKKSNADGALRVWDLAEQKQVTLLEGHRGSVYSVAYSKKSDLAASAGSDKTLRVWDTVHGRELWRKTCAEKNDCDGDMIAVAISPDGTVVASGGSDTIVRLWDAQTGKLLGSLKGHNNLVQFVEFSPDGKRIGSASDDATVRVWDIKTGKQIKVARDHKSSVWSLSFSPDGEMLATASSDGKVRLFWINDDKNPKAVLVRNGELKGHLEPVYAVAFSKDGQSLISTGQDGTLRLWGPTSEGASVAQINHTQAVTSVVVSPDGNLIASGSGDGTLQTWDRPSLDEPSTVTDARKSIPHAHRGEIHTLSFNADGTQLLSGGADNTVRFWSAATGQSLGPPLRGHTAAVRAVAWGANDQVVSAGEDGVIRVWNATSRETVNVITPPMDLPKDDKYKVWSIAVDPQGRYVAVGGSDGLLRFWNTRDGKEVAHPQAGHAAAIFAVAVSRDGTLIATGSADGGVFFWKVTSSKDGIKVKLHARSREPSSMPIYCVAFSADGKLVASSGEDKLLRIWNPEDGTRVGIPLAGHRGVVASVAFSSLGDFGDFIVSAGHDQKLLVWPGPELWANALCSRLNQNMSQKQWREWVSPDIKYHEQCPGLPILDDTPAQQPTTAATGKTQ